MKRTVNHALLDDAKSNKNDEFYTQLADIERELKHYAGHFKGKVDFVVCAGVRAAQVHERGGGASSPRHGDHGEVEGRRSFLRLSVRD